MRSLNRTSVGLKQSQAHPTPGGWQCLNRTSVGLKLILERGGDGNGKVPQSNQRGIETPELIVLQRDPHSGLNRTSVGLKRE